MKLYVKLLLAAFVLFGITCVNKNHKREQTNPERDALLAAIDKSKINTSNYDWVVILPELGCHGCIREAEIFMQENVNNDSILFVLTKVESLKILQHKIGVNLREHKNIYVDSDNLFVVPNENAIYPCVIRLQRGKATEYFFQAPGGPAFDRLREQIK